MRSGLKPKSEGDRVALQGVQEKKESPDSQDPYKAQVKTGTLPDEKRKSLAKGGGGRFRMSGYWGYHHGRIEKGNG